MERQDTGEEGLQRYLDLPTQMIRTYLLAILARPLPEPGRRQEAFNPVETLLCYGLFELLNPHRYGGGNIDQVPDAVKALALLFRRTAGSITNKMLNLDGSRTHSSRLEPLLYATLAAQPDRYASLYQAILSVARDISIGEIALPDFLHGLEENAKRGELLGQYELPGSSQHLLREAGVQMELERVDQAFHLGDRLTEKLMERRVRLVQHYFARDVLRNCGYTCVFCGFSPHTLLKSGSSLLRASHIKPWAVSDERERVDMRNGLAACPMHDAAFDQGYIAVGDFYGVLRSEILQESIMKDQGVSPYFADLLSENLLLPANAQRPLSHYLEYHLQYIFRVDASI